LVGWSVVKLVTLTPWLRTEDLGRALLSGCSYCSSPRGAPGPPPGAGMNPTKMVRTGHKPWNEIDGDERKRHKSATG